MFSPCPHLYAKRILITTGKSRKILLSRSVPKAKNELIYWCNFDRREEARAAIFDYLDVCYNRHHLPQTLNYQTSRLFEKLYDTAKFNCP
ncbi:MAG: IS3 family transposase [Gammaproteobacteria bacterium]|nr:IS3 family transposase [Gammaproteobacteria bacterium]